MITSYRDLVVWQKSMELAVEAYRTARMLPSEERFGLIAQLQRAAVGVPANIAEGRERKSRGDFRRFVAIARGSLAELETHLELIRRLKYLSDEKIQFIEALTTEVGRMLSVLLKRLGRKH